MDKETSIISLVGMGGRPCLLDVFKSHKAHVSSSMGYPYGLTKKEFEECVTDWANCVNMAVDEVYEYLLENPQLILNWMQFYGIEPKVIDSIGSGNAMRSCNMDDYNNLCKGLDGVTDDTFPWDNDDYDDSIDDWDAISNLSNIQCDVDDMGFDEYKGSKDVVPRGSVIDMEGNVISDGNVSCDGSASSWFGSKGIPKGKRSENNKGKKDVLNKEMEAYAMTEEGRWHCNIEFYDDPLNLKKFTVYSSLRSFSKFCEREEIYVDEITLKELVTNGKSYCCLDMFVQGSKTLVAYDCLECMKNDIIAIFGEKALKEGSSSKKRGSRGNKKNKKINIL